MDETPVPADHVIRPHHVALLSILICAFRDLEIKNFPTPYALYLQRVLLNEVSEVAQHRSHAELLSEICSGPQSDDPACSDFQMAVTTMHNSVTGVNNLSEIMTNLPALYLIKNPDEQPRLHRRSLFGFFARRCFVTFLKLSYFALDKLCEDFQAWCAGNATAGYDVFDKTTLSNDLLTYKTSMDKKSVARPDSYERWEKSLLVGDEKIAVENLRRFFEQHFHEYHDSWFRQHALLHLARLHYINGEHLSARQLLTEAIVASRNSNDRVTLYQSTSILHRLPSLAPGQKPFIHEIQADLHPLAVLFDVSKLLDPENDQPISAAFHKIFQGIALYDHWLDIQGTVPVEEYQWAQHAVQSIVWTEAGCNQIARIQENVVLALMPPGEGYAEKLTMALNKAYQIARQGDYNAALALLMDPSVWRGIILHDYVTWALEIWKILALRATRRGQLRLFREFLLPRRPKGPYNPKEYFFDVQTDKIATIRESLYQILQLRQLDQATSGIEHLLKALWVSEFLCRFNLYRTAIILLADIGLELGMTKRSRQILEEILPQVINGYDLEQRAVACFTLARCIIAAGVATGDSLREAIPHLLMAEADLQKLEMYTSMKDVQYMLSVVYHNLDMTEERQAAAQRHFDTEAFQKNLEIATSDTEILQVFELMEIVGSALASR